MHNMPNQSWLSLFRTLESFGSVTTKTRTKIASKQHVDSLPWICRGGPMPLDIQGVSCAFSVPNHEGSVSWVKPWCIIQTLMASFTPTKCDKVCVQEIVLMSFSFMPKTRRGINVLFRGYFGPGFSSNRSKRYKSSEEWQPRLIWHIVHTDLQYLAEALREISCKISPPTIRMNVKTLKLDRH